jgi:hypothetical protein
MAERVSRRTGGRVGEVDGNLKPEDDVSKGETTTSEAPKTVRRKSVGDNEVAALAAAIEALEALDEPTRARVMNYLNSRYAKPE